MADPLYGQRLVAKTRLRRNELRIERAIKRALAVHRDKALAVTRSQAMTAAIHPDAFDVVAWDHTVELHVLPTIGDVMTDLAHSATSFLSSSPELRSRILGQIDVTTRASGLAEKVRGMGPDLAQRVTEELTVGAAKGEGSKTLADRLDFVFNELGEHQAERIARTETHGASEAMSHDSANAISAAGLEVTKTWINTDDERTRDTHIDAGGQTVPIDQPFLVGDSELMYPGDPDGPPEETVNCRCSATYDLPQDSDIPEE